MTNAADVLLLDGPYNGLIYCLNKEPGMPRRVVFGFDPSPNYPVNKWWNAQTQRWYWLAIYSDAAMSDAEIANEIWAREFQPAWDMRNDAAPSSQTETQS